MTKKRILTVSSKLFFEHGIANVRLQQIANEANISVGNLAYHYKNKEAIVHAIYEEVFIEIHALLDGDIPTQDFADFDKSLRRLYKFNIQYNFCFLNVWEIARNYPQLQLEWEAISKSLLSIIFKRLNLYTQKHLLHSEPFKGYYKTLSHQLLLNIFSWIPFQLLSGRTANLTAFTKSIWSLFIPHFTETGFNEYKNLGITPSLN